MTDDVVKEGDILAGKYKVERVLGHGGMGVVVAAIHQQLEQRVALKFLLPDGVANESTVGRFMREARAAVRLRSEHVARVLDVGTSDGGSPYIVMEYLEGEDLAAVIDRDKRLPVPRAVTYLLQACEAVAEAHALGIIHRDLKPANLFVTKRPDGSPCIKVLDFGIAKFAGAVSDNLTKTSTMMGTPYYMSPEQMRSSKDADERSDIWALAMILYEMLSGQVAFVRDTLPNLCSAILFEPTPRLCVEGSNIPPALEGIIMRALEKEPAKRYANLAEFGAALAPFANEGGAAKRRIQRTLMGGVGLSDAPEPLATTPPPASPDLISTAMVPSPASEVTAALDATAQADSAKTGIGAAKEVPNEDDPDEVAPSPPRKVSRWVVMALMVGVAVAGTTGAMRMWGSRSRVDPAGGTEAQDTSSAASGAVPSQALTAPALPEASAFAPESPTLPPPSPASDRGTARPTAAHSGRPAPTIRAVTPVASAKTSPSGEDLGPRK